MRISAYRHKTVLTLVLAAGLLVNSLPTFGQSIIPVSDITGGSSVFVFRKTPKDPTTRFVSQTKTNRTKDQRIQGAKKVNRQYVDLAKTAPRRVRTTAVDPNTLPPKERINLMPKDQAAKLFAGVGEWYIDREDNDHAEDFFRTAYELDASNSVAKNGLSEALSLQGNALLVKDDQDSAQKKYKEALTLNPNNAVPYFGLGQIAADAQDDKTATANFEKAIDLDPALTNIYVPLGILYFQNREIEKADKLLSKALAHAPEDPETEFYLGLVRYTQGNRDAEALAAFRKAKSVKPDYAEAWNYTGLTLMRMDKEDDAIVEFTKATELKPDYFDAWFGLGTAYMVKDDYPKAVDAFNHAVTLKNSSAEAQANLGDAYRLSGNYRDAEGRYNIANALAPNSKSFSQTDQADVYNKIGFVIAKQCDAYAVTNTRCGWQRAVTALEKAVAISHSPVDYANLGWAYYNAAQNDKVENNPDSAKAKLLKAKENLEKAIASSPSYVDGPLLNLAVTNRELGDTQGSIDALKKVVANKPDWVFARTELGMAYLEANNAKGAADEFRKAISKDDKYVSAYFGLGKAEFINGNLGEAKKAYLKLKSLKASRLADALALFSKGALLS